MLDPIVRRTGRVAITDDEVDGSRVMIWPSRDRTSWDRGVGAYLLIVTMMLTVLWFSKPAGHPNATPRELLPGRIAMTLALAAGGAGLLLCYDSEYNAREIVRTDGQSLLVRRESRLIHESRSFQLAEIEDVRHDPAEIQPNHDRPPRRFGVGGSIAFESNGKTFRFGLDLTPGDVDRIMDWIASAKDR